MASVGADCDDSVQVLYMYMAHIVSSYVGLSGPKMHIDALVQDYSIFSTFAMDILQSSTKLLNLRALMIWTFNENHTFECMGKIFCWNFKFHGKYLTRWKMSILFRGENLRTFTFESLLAILNWVPASWSLVHVAAEEKEMHPFLLYWTILRPSVSFSMFRDSFKTSNRRYL